MSIHSRWLSTLLALVIMVALTVYATTQAPETRANLSVSAANPAGPWIFVSPGAFDVTHTNPPEVSFEEMTIENTGSDFVNYSLHTATDNCDFPTSVIWLSPSSGGGNLPPLSLEFVQIQFSSEGLPNGSYSALICVRDTTHPSNPYHQVFVQFTVAAPPTPKPPTWTPEPPTATPEIPTATPELPTATPELPSPTPELPSPTPEAPTATPELPTPTVEPGTPTVTPQAGATFTPTPPATHYYQYLPLARRR